MSVGGLNWQTLHLPFAVGLQQGSDDRARPQPALDIASDVQFDETGGVQTRLPFDALSNNITGGGTLSACRRIHAFGDKLLLQTADTLYEYDSQLASWTARATNMAIAVDEAPVFVSTGDQITCDRAELSGRIYYAWTEASRVYMAIVDKTTGAVFMAPTKLDGGAATGTRPRLVALTTKVLLFWNDGTDASPGALLVYAFDPAATSSTADAAALTAGTGDATVLAAGSFGSYYDVVKIPGADSAIAVMRRVTTTSYTIAKVTSALSVATATPARSADGPLAVSVDPTGATAQVIRADTTNIVGDRITVSSLADAATAQAVGTVAGVIVNQIAACHRSTTDSGAYRCYAFWSAQETDAEVGFETKYNFVDTAGTIGTEASFVKRVGVVSRAFDYAGRVYFHVGFAGTASSVAQFSSPLARAQLQNTYFLYRDDALLCGKVVAAKAGGFSAATGHLPGVALVSGSTDFAWCGGERRVIALGGGEGNFGHSGYGDRGPIDLSIKFNSTSARRMVQLGRTIYLTGSEVLQYDGGLYELGFHIYPWLLGGSGLAGAAGAIVPGAYSYKTTWRWENGVGEMERSAVAFVQDTTVAANGQASFAASGHYVTHKTSARSPISVEIWRTKIDPEVGVDFFLTTSKDPAVLSGNNRYIANDITAYSQASGLDNFADTTLGIKETNPENGGVLEALAPAAATIIAASDSRLFLAGLSGDPHRVWYSKLRDEGQVVAFNDLLAFDVPQIGGDITAMAVREGAIVVWRETAVYLIPGDGFTNTGEGQNYGPAQTISVDVGTTTAESVCLTDKGWIFQSAKGWHLLDRAFGLTYIGDAVSDYDSETVLSVQVMTTKHQVRCLTTSRMLVFDLRSNQWSEWSIADGLDACIWNGRHVYLTATGPKRQALTYASLTYGLDVETAWIKLADLQGSARVRKVQPIGEFRSAHYLRVRIAYNYAMASGPVPDYVDDKSWPASPASVTGNVLQVLHGVRRPQCESIKVRLTAVAADTLLTASELSAVLALSVGNWTATLTGVVPRSFSIGLVDGSAAEVDVRDNERWTGVLWESEPGNCGVKVTGHNSTFPVTMAVLEAAINASSSLVQVTSAHATPSHTVDFTGALLNTYASGAFAAASPTGEALKLTELALEVGAEPGLYRRLPASQRQ